ncbi:MAG: hypothetical protein ACE3L7_03995 [Candidatus Pristimantibacillus sp.]
MRKGWRNRIHFRMGVSRDGGITWTQEIVDVRELDPEKNQIKVGEIFWFRKSKFIVEMRDGRLQAIATI